MEFLHCQTGRRSVRSYLSDPVSDEQISHIVDAARFSPSWANSQCVRYLAVRDSETRSRLAGIMSPRNPGTDGVRNAPIVIVFVAVLGKAGCKKGEPVDDRAWHMFDTGVAVQSFCLAAHDKGLGTVIIGFFDHRKAAEILGLPDNMEVVAFTPLGVPAKDSVTPKRLDVSDLLCFETLSEGG